VGPGLASMKVARLGQISYIADNRAAGRRTPEGQTEQKGWLPGKRSFGRKTHWCMSKKDRADQGGEM